MIKKLLVGCIAVTPLMASPATALDNMPYVWWEDEREPANYLADSLVDGHSNSDYTTWYGGGYDRDYTGNTSGCYLNYEKNSGNEHCSLNVTNGASSDTGYCVPGPGDSSGSDGCGNICKNRGYQVTVYYVYHGTDFYWTCACKPGSPQTEWRTASAINHTERNYKQKANANSGCLTEWEALDQYRCMSGYYGSATAASSNCTKCPENATCAGGTSFVCKDGYYTNSAGTGCNKCPNSKEGNLGWDTNGNGIDAINGGVVSKCTIATGTVLHDAAGTFQIEPSETKKCEYEP